MNQEGVSGLGVAGESSLTMDQRFVKVQDQGLLPSVLLPLGGRKALPDLCTNKVRMLGYQFESQSDTPKQEQSEATQYLKFVIPLTFDSLHLHEFKLPVVEARSVSFVVNEGRVFGELGDLRLRHFMLDALFDIPSQRERVVGHEVVVEARLDNSSPGGLDHQFAHFIASY